jgi:hypothetical protein
MSESANISTWPARIYLQHGDEPEVPPFPDVYAADAVTWCIDKIEDADVEYVRVDIAGSLLEALKFMLDRFDQRDGNVFSQRLACDKAREVIAKATKETA